jgi:hypothetical protein
MPDVIEASGIAASRRNPGVLWVHNDAGSGSRIYALTSAGVTLAVYDLSGTSSNDWEDVAVGPGPGGSSALYVGDIGDNSLSRTSITVYRVIEPEVGTMPSSTPKKLSGAEAFPLIYPDRPHNAEALLVDPKSGDVYVVVKSEDGVSPVFRAAAPLVAGAQNPMVQVQVLKFGAAPLSGNAQTTGGSISPSGDEIVIRTYGAAFLWRRAAGATVAEALGTAPCPLPLQKEPQGEAIGFAEDGGGYYTVSEGAAQPIYFYARR